MAEFGNNSNMINHLTYPQTFTNANVPKPIKYIQNNHRIVVRSEDRDRSKYSNPCEFRIDLPCRFRNVSLFEIGSIMIPNFSNTEKYFIIQVDEVKDGVYTSTNTDISNAMAIVPNSLGLNNYNYIYEKPGDTSFVKNFIKKFVDTPLASLSTITLKILKPDGNVMNFGNDMIQWDKEYSFSSSESEAGITDFRLKFNNLGHDLKGDDTPKDKIIVYNAQVAYTNKNNQKITKSFQQLNGEYDYSNGTAGKVISSVLTENEALILINDNIKINTEKIIDEIDGFVEDSNGPITISGNWKRAYKADGYYSRVAIASASADAATNIIDVATTTNHNLKQHDRIYIDKNIGDSQTQWIKNYHVVIKITGDTTFELNANNITQDDLINDITDNPILPNQAWLDNDDADTEDNNDQIGTTEISTTPVADVFLQRYGDPDPSIQNMFIFNIGCREEDNDNVMSQNISYGNTKW